MLCEFKLLIQVNPRHLPSHDILIVTHIEGPQALPNIVGKLQSKVLAKLLPS